MATRDIVKSQDEYIASMLNLAFNLDYYVSSELLSLVRNFDLNTLSYDDILPIAQGASINIATEDGDFELFGENIPFATRNMATRLLVIAKENGLQKELLETLASTLGFSATVEFLDITSRVVA